MEPFWYFSLVLAGIGISATLFSLKLLSLWLSRRANFMEMVITNGAFYYTIFNPITKEVAAEAVETLGQTQYLAMVMVSVVLWVAGTALGVYINHLIREWLTTMRPQNKLVQ